MDYHCRVFLMSKQPHKREVGRPQNVEPCSSWQQDHHGRCFPNSLLCGPGRTWSCNTVWRTAGCLVLIPNVKESKYQTPPRNRITTLHPAAFSIHSFTAHGIWFHILLVCWFSNCAKCTMSTTETASEHHALPKYLPIFASACQHQQHCQEQAHFGIAALGSVSPYNYLIMKCS